MSKELYQQIYGEDYQTNVLMVQDNNLNEEQEETIMQEMVARNEVSIVTLTSTTMKTLDDTMNSLNYVVVVLIVSAGLLAFVVLYNLSNINISERIRELATIKVLGFYDREVYDYVTREMIILTIIGIVLGLVAGYFLNFYILGTCEINILRFEKVVHPLSYVYAVAITLVFSVIIVVNSSDNASFERDAISVISTGCSATVTVRVAGVIVNVAVPLWETSSASV